MDPYALLGAVEERRVFNNEEVASVMRWYVVEIPKIASRVLQKGRTATAKDASAPSVFTSLIVDFGGD